MLESGASRVFWVRCRRQRMHAALEALLTRLDPGALVVAESNSLAAGGRAGPVPHGEERPLRFRQAHGGRSDAPGAAVWSCPPTARSI